MADGGDSRKRKLVNQSNPPSRQFADGHALSGGLRAWLIRRRLIRTWVGKLLAGKAMETVAFVPTVVKNQPGRDHEGEADAVGRVGISWC